MEYSYRVSTSTYFYFAKTDLLLLIKDFAVLVWLNATLFIPKNCRALRRTSTSATERHHASQHSASDCLAAREEKTYKKEWVREQNVVWLIIGIC